MSSGAKRGESRTQSRSLRRRLFRRCFRKRQNQYEFRALPHLAGHLDPPVVFFGNPPRQREPQPRAVPLGRIKRSKNIRQMFRRNPAPGIGHADRGVPIQLGEFHPNFSRRLNGLHCIQQEVQQHLVNLIAVVLHWGQRRIFLQFNLDGLRNHLLASQHDRVLRGRIQITRSNFRGMGAGCLQQICENVIDLRNFQANIFYHRPRRARGWQISAHDLNHSRNPSQRIANLMRQPGRQFSQRSQVFRSRHLRAMQPLDLFAALPNNRTI